MLPYLTSTEIEQIIYSFEHNVNSWYPTVSQTKLKMARSLIAAGKLDDSTTSCFVLSVMALGCTSQACSGLVAGVNLSMDEKQYRASRREMAQLYMDGLLKKLHLVHMEMSAPAVQCLFLVA
jgi:hypothetical protein